MPCKWTKLPLLLNKIALLFEQNWFTIWTKLPYHLNKIALPFEQNRLTFRTKLPYWTKLLYLFNKTALLFKHNCPTFWTKIELFNVVYLGLHINIFPLFSILNGRMVSEGRIQNTQNKISRLRLGFQRRKTFAKIFFRISQNFAIINSATADRKWKRGGFHEK